MTEKLIKFMEREYVRSGFMYSGCVSVNYVSRELDIDSHTAIDLLFGLAEKGIIKKRDCDATAFELTEKDRIRLINLNHLRAVWQEQHPEFYPLASWGEIGKLCNV